MSTPAMPHVACGDCERVRPGLIGQPANTLSSLAFVAAAVPVWRAADREADRDAGRDAGRDAVDDGPAGRVGDPVADGAAAVGAWRAVALASVAAGLGSVGYHGPGGALGKSVHDVGVGALAVALVGALASDRRRPSRAALAVGAAAGLLHLTSRTGGPLCRPDSPWQGHAGWHLLAATAVWMAARG